MLALPDRRLLLDPVDDMTVGDISLAAVGRSRDDHYRRLPDFHPTDPMLSYRDGQIPPLPRLGQDLRDHLLRQRHMRLIFQKSNLFPLIAFPHLATEQYYRPGGRMMPPSQQSHQVDRLIHHTPGRPDTPRRRSR